MNAFLSFGTPIQQYQHIYGEQRLFSGPEKTITTQLPKNIALIRIVTTVALTILLAIKLKTTAFCWPVVVLGTAFTAWTAYAHLLSKDPLLEVFYQIIGGENKFENLPEINLTPTYTNEKIFDKILDLKWDSLTQPMYRTTTQDGRKVIVVKALDENRDSDSDPKTQSILVFIEKLGPEDFRYISTHSKLIDVVLHAIYTPFKGKPFGNRLVDSTREINGRIIKVSAIGVSSSITTSMANEFFAKINRDSIDLFHGL